MILTCSLSKDGGLISVKIYLRSYSTQLSTRNMPLGWKLLDFESLLAPSTGGITISSNLTVNMLFFILVSYLSIAISLYTRLQLLIV